jgi:mannose-1-phosphate guanylyltransferase/phosphomannomutase
MYEMRQKSRLTITLPTDLLHQVDNQVDGKTIRNRSHAIELLVRTGLQPSITTAVILAGGPEAKKNIAGLQNIAGRPLLAVTLENLRHHGIREVLIAAGQAEREVKEIFGTGDKFGIEIRYLAEKKPLGTAGVLKRAESLLRGNPFLVVHGDVLTDINLSDLFSFHLREDTLVTLSVKPRISEKNYGQAFLQGNKIVRFMERGEVGGISIVNTGIYVVKPELLKRFPKSKSFSMEAEVLPDLAVEGQLSAFLFQGFWSDVTDKKAYQAAIRQWPGL